MAALAAGPTISPNPTSLILVGHTPRTLEALKRGPRRPPARRGLAACGRRWESMCLDVLLEEQLFCQYSDSQAWHA